MTRTPVPSPSAKEPPMSKLTAKQLTFLEKHLKAKLADPPPYVAWESNEQMAKERKQKEALLEEHLKAQLDGPPPPYVVAESQELNEERQKLIDDSFLTPEKKQQLAEERKQKEAEKKRKGQAA